MIIGGCATAGIVESAPSIEKGARNHVRVHAEPAPPRKIGRRDLYCGFQNRSEDFFQSVHAGLLQYRHAIMQANEGGV
jgi:hypothetical protein